MNRHLYILIMWLCSLSAFAQTNGYDPENPPLPDFSTEEEQVDTTKYYSLKVMSSPVNSGSLNTSGGKYTENASIYLRANNSGNFQFKYWIDSEGTVVSTSSSFYYTMPKHDVVMTAVYRYEPQNPSLPEIPEDEENIPRYNLTLDTKPAGAGSFNISSTTLKDQESIHLYAYSNSNFYFKHWEDAAGNIVSTAQNFYYLMSASDTRLYAVYTYNPGNPGNPGKNDYDSFTGEVIVDDFTRGNLSSAIYDVTKGNTSNITKITVAGQVNSNDFSIANNYSTCTIVDLSRTSGVSYVPSYCYNSNSYINRISLPASITNIEYYAFRNATALTELTCYSPVPPTLGSAVFSGITPGLVVYVPASSVELYEQAAGWKDYEAAGTIVIMPVQDQVSSLEVNLPEECLDGRYKNMPLELLNVKSGQKFKYVVTDRINYTFNNLVNGTRYVATLKNLSGQILARTDTVSIEGENLSVSFDLAQMKQLRTVNATILNSNGADVTSNCTVTWYDAHGTFLAQGNTLTSQVSGTNIKCAVTLPQALALEYIQPADSVYEVVEGENNLVCQLANLPTMRISGHIMDVTSQQGVSNANVTVSQTLNGKYSKSFSVRTDNKGAYSLTVFVAPTSVTYAANDYVSQTVELDNLKGDANTLADVMLKPITGATITTNFTYTVSAAATVAPEVQNYYSDYNNVAYNIYNVTSQKEIKQFNVQYPNIVLLEEVSEGDSLTIVAKSKNGSFKDITTGGRIDNALRMSVTVPVVQWGGVDATFTTTENSKVLGILYDSKGTFVNRYNYGTSTLSIRELKDGEYTLVTMGASDFFGSIYNLEKFSEAGLQQNIDYLVNKVTVKSGIISPLKNVLVPFFDESKFYYTGDNTSFTVNKTSIVAGNYLTLTAKVDFKDVYKNSISDVKVSVELPEGTSMVDNSVMVGSSVAYYELNGNTLTIPLDNNVSSDRVRFCVIPTQSGSFAPNASVAFKLGEKSVSQPMGSTSYTVKDIAISVPSEINTPEITITGVASGKAEVVVYANGDVLGTTTALANGWWSMTTELDDPYNLQEFDIYADVTSSTGLSVKTETQKCLYNKDVIVAKTVEMSFYNGWMNKNITVTFDLEHQTSDATSYSFYHETDFTFAANLSNNDTTIVKSVTIGVYTNHEGWIDLEATYNAKMDRWVAVHKFGSSNLPTGVKVDFEADYDEKLDRRELLDGQSELLTIITESVDDKQTLLKEWNSEVILENAVIFQELDNMLLSEEFSYDDLHSLIGQIVATTESEKFDEEELFNAIHSHIAEYEGIVSDSTLFDITSDVLTTLDYTPELPEEYDYVMDTDNGNVHFIKTKITEYNEQELTDNGFSKIVLTDGSFIFFKDVDDTRCIIDIKEMCMYEMYPDSTSNANESSDRRQARAVSLSWIKNLESIVHNIVNIKDGIANKDDIREVIKAISAASSLLKEAVELTQSIYKANIDNIINSFNSSTNGWMNDINQSINKLDKDKYDLSKQINAYEADYKQIESEIKSLDIEIAEYQRQYDAATEVSEKYRYQNLIIEKQNARSVRVGLLKEQTRLLRVAENEYTRLQKAIADANKKLKDVEKFVDNTKNFFAKIPKTVQQARGLKFIQVSGKVAKFIGTPVGAALQIIPIVFDMEDYVVELADWLNVASDVLERYPCEDNKEGWNKLAMKCAAYSYTSLRLASENIKASIAAAVLDIPSVSVPHAWVASLVLDLYSWGCSFANNKIKSKYPDQIRREAWNLKCKDDKCPKCHKKPCECEKPCPTCGQKPCICCDYCHSYPCKCQRCHRCGKRVQECTCKPCKKCGHIDCICKPEPEIPPIMDPSGFVYEGVSTNRLPGVTATCYYKELVEDMYGDLHENIVLWDAEEYAQKNPLFTDENGMYQWDVPQGLWQVRFEKEGYVPTQSEWLPVPPPQMDVNIAMVQNAQPEVVSARAYEDGVEIEFSKYMNIESLNSENVYLKVVNGKEESLITDAEIQMLNKEVTIEGSTTEFASKIKLATDTLGYFDEAYLIISTGVNSYAGIPMAHTFEQKLDVERKVRELLVDAEVNVEYDGKKEITIAAIPADAAAGKKLSVVSASDMIATTDVQEVTFDADGQATFTVNGELYGATALNYSLVDADLKATSLINVLDPKKLEAVKTPTASRISGTSVYRGQTVTLSCESEGSTIYYTTDGSCPCDENARMKYERPIAINDAMTLKFMSVGTNFDESDVVECTYSIRQSDVKLNLAKGWNWNSHDVASPLQVSELTGIASRIMTQTDEAIDDPILGFVGTLQTIDASETMKIETTEAAMKAFEGEQYNPAKNNINLVEGWNWLGYPINQTMTLEDALSYLEVEEGDVVSNLEQGFATYTDGTWVGDLQTLNAGYGYLYKSMSNKSFIYNLVPTVSNAKAIHGHRLILTQAPWMVNKHQYPNLMPVIAQVCYSNGEVADSSYYVGAFVGDECRGVAQYADGSLFLSVYGTGKSKVTFKAVNVQTGDTYDFAEALPFGTDMAGSIQNPFKLYLNFESTGIHTTMKPNSINEIYTVNGMKVDRATRPGFYIMKGVDASGKIQMMKQYVK